MTTKVKLKEAYEVESKWGAFYTGGHIEWHQGTLYCQTENCINLLDYETGKITQQIPAQNHQQNNDDNSHELQDTVHTFTADGASGTLITAHHSGLLRHWGTNKDKENSNEYELKRAWKSFHKGPVTRLRLQHNILYSGGADGSIRTWDLDSQTCTAHLHGTCTGVITNIECTAAHVLASGTGDGSVHSWTLPIKDDACVTYTAHFSPVTSLVVANNQKNFVTSGRDKMLILWTLNSTVPLKSFPVYEVLESLALLPDAGRVRLPELFAKQKRHTNTHVYVMGAGEGGVLRVWECCEAREVYKQPTTTTTPSLNSRHIVRVIKNSDESNPVYCAVHEDHTINAYQLATLDVAAKQFVGFSDEILAACFVGEGANERIVVASNSPDLKLYQAGVASTDSTMECTIVKGHTETVLSLTRCAANRSRIASTAKDNQIRVWDLKITCDNGGGGANLECVAVGVGHQGSVTSAAFLSATHLVSVANDSCLKLWQFVPPPTKFLTCTKSELAHAAGKDVNDVAVSPNATLVATASQDKTAKIWRVDGGGASESPVGVEVAGVLRGHKRGVWSVRFSPVDQVCATASADCTIRMWSMNDFGCLKTFAQHDDAAVLRLQFLRNGLQIVSGAADGLMRLFDIKTTECVCTFAEGHTGRIWALDISTGLEGDENDDERIITGGADSVLIKWRDVTQTRVQERQAALELKLELEQTLENEVRRGRWVKALKLALRLERPMQVLRIIEKIVALHNVNDNVTEGGEGVNRFDSAKRVLGEILAGLRSDQKAALLRCVADWNTNSKSCFGAQVVLHCLLGDLQSGALKPEGFSGILEGLIPYTERHFKRVSQTLGDLFFIDYTLRCMEVSK